MENNIKKDKPFWEVVGYTAQEWKLRKYFENKGSDNETYSAYVTDLEEFEIYKG